MQVIVPNAAPGARDQQNQATIDRGKMRTVLGSELIRELVLK